MIEKPITPKPKRPQATIRIIEPTIKKFKVRQSS